MSPIQPGNCDRQIPVLPSPAPDQTQSNKSSPSTCSRNPAGSTDSGPNPPVQHNRDAPLTSSHLHPPSSPLRIANRSLIASPTRLQIQRTGHENSCRTAIVHGRPCWAAARTISVSGSKPSRTSLLDSSSQRVFRARSSARRCRIRMAVDECISCPPRYKRRSVCLVSWFGHRAQQWGADNVGGSCCSWMWEEGSWKRTKEVGGWVCDGVDGDGRLRD